MIAARKKDLLISVGIVAGLALAHTLVTVVDGNPETDGFAQSVPAQEVDAELRQGSYEVADVETSNWADAH